MTKKEIVDHAKSIDGMVWEGDLDILYDFSQEYIRSGGYALEIGPWKGRSSYVIASVCREKGAVLYTLDTFRGVDDYETHRSKFERNAYHEAVVNPDFYKIFINNIRGLPVAILIGNSNEVINHIPDKICDFAFIDGNHESPAINNDIKNCIRKVRTGGMVSGHDLGIPWTDVKKAVEEILKKDWQLNVRPGLCTVWSHVVKEKYD